MPDLDWDSVKGFFTAYYLGDNPEGFVPDCTMADWEKLFDFLRSGGWRHEYLIDAGHYNRTEPLPSSPREPMRRNAREECSAMLKVWPEPSLLVWFWVEQETRVRFDVSLYRQEGQAGLDAVCGFLGTLGRLLGKPVYFGEHDEVPDSGEGGGGPVLEFDLAGGRVVVSGAAG